MKNILKKIGLIAIIIGVLSPFISLPSVKAQNDGCEYYLNQYLFLDVTNGNDWAHYTKRKGYRTYTTFLYTFLKPLDGKVLTVEKVGEMDLVDEDGDLLDEFRSTFRTLVNDNDRKISLSNKLGNFSEYEFYSGDYKSKTAILHGYWGYENDDYIRVDYDEIIDNIGSASNFRNHSIQGVMIDHEIDTVNLEVEFSGATLVNKEFGPVYSDKESGGTNGTIKDYLQQVINDVNSGFGNSKSDKNSYVWESDGEYYVNLGIRRLLDEDDLNDLIFGTDNYAWSTSDGTKLSDVDDSYKAMINYIEAEEDGKLLTSEQITNGEKNLCKNDSTECYKVTVDNDDINIDTTTYYYWPVIMNVEYSVCSTVSNTPSNPKSWTLTYDKGVSGDEAVKVQNMPNPNSVSNITTTTYTLSSTKPEREGYEFKSWCTDKDGKGTCVEAGKEFKNEKMEDDILYAYWVKPGTENNEKQGVMSYVFGFIGVGLIAYGLYYVINKKNLFKQI